MGHRALQRDYRGCYTYRSHRIADLYAHPALPVEDLTIAFTSGNTLLQFSADETRTYTVQASNDLQTWFDIGTPSEGSPGNFEFQDPEAPGDSRYYRVISN